MSTKGENQHESQDADDERFSAALDGLDVTSDAQAVDDDVHDGVFYVSSSYVTNESAFRMPDFDANLVLTQEEAASYYATSRESLNQYLAKRWSVRTPTPWGPAKIIRRPTDPEGQMVACAIDEMDPDSCDWALPGRSRVLMFDSGASQQEKIRVAAGLHVFIAEAGRGKSYAAPLLAMAMAGQGVTPLFLPFGEPHAGYIQDPKVAAATYAVMVARSSIVCVDGLMDMLRVGKTKMSTGISAESLAILASCSSWCAAHGVLVIATVNPGALVDTADFRDAIEKVSGRVTGIWRATDNSWRGTMRVGEGRRRLTVDFHPEQVLAKLPTSTATMTSDVIESKPMAASVLTAVQRLISTSN